MSSLTVEVEDLSRGWLGACASVLGCHRNEANHLIVRMAEPLPEDAAIRAATDVFLSAAGHQEIDEVRNTIFPAELARDFSDPAELAAAYLEDYDVLKALGSRQGTYFGRICAYPQPDGRTTTPQLMNTVAKLREASAGTRWRARYQLNIYAEHKDSGKKRGNFPCMAHLSFQLGGAAHDRLDCLSLYRFQDMVLKGYGNFLGVAELQHYLATASGFRPGELTVVAGHAALTLSRASRAHLRTIVGDHAP